MDEVVVTSGATEALAAAILLLVPWPGAARREGPKDTQRLWHLGDLKPGERRVIEYFLSPLFQAKDESLRER